MFSRRIPWSLTRNALSVALEARRAAARVHLDLTESNPTRAGLSYPRDAVLSALSHPDAMQYDPAPQGLLAARESIARYYLDSLGAHVDPAHIVLTASTSEAYAFVFKLLCDPGTRVLIPAPSYPLFDLLAALESVAIDRYPLAYDGRWHLDASALAASITTETRAVLCVHPNNPTGSFLTHAELAALATHCNTRDMAIVSDEVFADYAFAPEPQRVRTFATHANALTFTLSGLSKVAGLPQMKLAWIVVSGPDELARDALARLELIADTFLSVGSPVQCAASALLASRHGVHDQIATRTRQNLDVLKAMLAADTGSLCTLLDVEAGWYATLRIPATRSEQDWTLAFLEHDDVLVQPGYFFDFPHEAFVVVSLLTPPETFREGLARVLDRVRREA